MIILISPTGRAVRGSDNWGSGKYGASRGERMHTGADFVCKPGQKVFMPIRNGLIEREARPYVESYFSGVVISNDRLTVKLFYFSPHKFLIGARVAQGEEIGIAQDISVKYPGIVPHVHLQVEHIDPDVLIMSNKEGE